MKTASSVDFDHASASELKMLAPLYSDEMANQMRERLRELGPPSDANARCSRQYFVY
jgi:hypothetical protein